MRFGLPKVLTSDQGNEFNNPRDAMLMEMLGIDHPLTTPYHPQVNAERGYAYACLLNIITYITG